MAQEKPEGRIRSFGRPARFFCECYIDAQLKSSIAWVLLPFLCLIMMVYFLLTWSVWVHPIFSFLVPFFVLFPVRPTKRFYSTPQSAEITSISQLVNHLVDMSPTLILPGSEHFEPAQSLLRLSGAISTTHEHDDRIMSQLPGTWYTIFTDIPLRSRMPFSEAISECCSSDPMVDIVAILQQIGNPDKNDAGQGTFNTSILFKLTGLEDIFTESIEGTYSVSDNDTPDSKHRLVLNFISSHLSTWEPDGREEKLHKLVLITNMKPAPMQTLISPPQDPGWMTTTFLSDDGDFRIATNNKDYTFVMKKIMLAEDDERPVDNSDDIIKEIIHNEVDSHKPEASNNSLSFQTI